MFGWLHYQKRMVRKEIKHRIIEGINREELVLLSFTHETASNLRWEHAREFEFGGEMYDVVETVMAGDTIYYWCWPDKEESSLNRVLAALTQKAMNGLPQRQEQQQQLLSFFKSLYVYSEHVDTVATRTLPKSEAFHFAPTYSAPYLSSPAPPPRKG